MNNLQIFRGTFPNTCMHCADCTKYSSFTVATWDKQFFVFLIHHGSFLPIENLIQTIYQNVQNLADLADNVREILNVIEHNMKMNIVGFVMKMETSLSSLHFWRVERAQNQFITLNFVIKGSGDKSKWYEVEDDLNIPIDSEPISFVIMMAERTLLVNTKMLQKQIQDHPAMSQTLENVCKIFGEANENSKPLIFSGNLSKIIGVENGYQESNQNVRITSLYNNQAYIDWLNRNSNKLLSISKNEMYNACNIIPNCFILNRLIGRGGGSYVIEARYKDVNIRNANNLFPVNPNDIFVMKLCDISLLGSDACKGFGIEANHLLLYSKLFSYRICETFNYMIGYGVNCCVLINQFEREPIITDMTKLQNYNILQKIFKTNYNIKEYYDDIVEDDNSCDSFLLMNYVKGTDLKYEKGKKISHRQLFELVYGYLCSCYFFGFIPADRHDDNFMECNTDFLLMVTIGQHRLIFPTEQSSLVVIDYMVVKDVTNITWGNIDLKRWFDDDDEIFNNLKYLLDSDQTCLQKIYQLPGIFNKYSSNQFVSDANLSIQLQFRDKLE